MSIAKISKDDVCVKEIINSGNHYAYVLELYDGQGTPPAVSFMTSLGISYDRAFEIYRTVVERCEVGTLYPITVTLLPPFFWLDKEKSEEYLSDLLKADSLMQSKSIYVRCNFDFAQILKSSDAGALNKKWIIIE